jgi:DNA processing protein
MKELLDKAKEIILKVTTLGAQIITIDSPKYPQLLAQIPDAPPVIYVKGTLPANIDKSIAVVGTRRCTEDAAAKAGEIASCLSRLGRPLVSGLALGIDSAAHRASIAYGAPTVAVMAHGLDRIHPKSHEKLALRLLENGGAWVSEHPPGTEVLPWMFASRNRILVGLCQATIMVQSPLKGGSMISARLALDYNRDTYAVVPDHGYSRVWDGNKDLILNSAAQKLVSIGDLPFFLGKFDGTKSATKVKVAASANSSIEMMPERCRGVYDEIIRYQVLTPRDLALKLGERIRVIRTRLFVLELLRLVRRIPGDRYILA